MRQTARLAQRVLLWIGLATIAYAGGTVAYAGIFQRYQVWKFERNNAQYPALKIELQDGGPVGKLEIPRIGISVMVLQGTEDDALAFGAGHVSGTPLPGTAGNFAIAAHRDTFFRNLKDIRRGDNIRYSTVRQSYEYIVDSMETVDPDNTQILESHARPELTLITCFPFYFIGSAPKRFVVHALLVK
jgi:sortase A